MPVIGINSGKYDLNAIKKFLIPHLLLGKEDEEEEEKTEDGVSSCFMIKR